MNGSIDRQTSFGQEARRDPAPPTAALITPPGRGAVATIQVIGERSQIGPVVDQYFAAANGRKLADQPCDRICFGHWGEAEREEVVVCRTSETAMEINCHGGSAAVNRILSGLSSQGIRTVDWQVQVAHHNGPLEAEILETLSRATTATTAVILHRQCGGRLKSAYQELLHETRRLERADDSDAAFEQQTTLSSKLDSLIDRATTGLRLSEPGRILIVGRPNSGKSTVLNALLGFQRAIVYDEPGTTRDLVTGETAFDGWPVVLTDTAGFRETTNELESEGIARARQQINQCDCICLLCDVSRPRTEEDNNLLALVQGSGSPVLMVGHKWDLPNVWGESLPEHAIPVSSITGEGLSDLMTELSSRIVPALPDPDDVIPVTGRQVDCLVRTRDALRHDDVASAIDALNELLDPNTILE